MTAKELLRGGHTLIGLCRSDDATDRLAKLSVAPLLGDLRRPESWANQVTSADCLIHLGAAFDEEMQAVEAKNRATLT